MGNPSLVKSRTLAGRQGVNIERLLQINLAALATLATMVLGIAQGDVQLPMMVLVAAIASVVFTDALGWFRLNRFIANIFAVLAAVYSLNAFFETGRADQLFAIANLLVYLQLILLFQKKDVRIYWQLFVLSLLQVVVAAALNMNLVAGSMMVLYMVVGVSALSLFFVYRECKRLAGVPLGQKPLKSQPAAKSESTRRKQNKDAPIAVPVVARLVLTSRMLSRRLAVQVAAVAFATLILTAVLFFGTPRQGRNPWYGPPGVAGAKSGFTGDINLNRSSRIQLSNQEVMRVAFRDLATGKPYEFEGEPYFRGAVLVDYYMNEQKWTPRLATGEIRTLLPPLPPDTTGFVRQDTVMEATAGNVAFAVTPAFDIDDSPVELIYDGISRQLSYAARRERPRKSAADILQTSQEVAPVRFDFGVATSAFRNGRLAPAIPADRLDAREHWQGHTISFRLPGQTTVRQTAARVLAENQIGKDFMGNVKDIVAAARAMETHFNNSGLYRYTLDLSSIKRKEDPIVDFLTRNRAGHCEFFASALTLMLRSQKIHARIVVGFKGGVYNPMGKYFHVRQRDAHAWVEAYIPRDLVTSDMLGPGQSAERGAWLRLDPTPAATDEPTPSRAGHLVDYMEGLWEDYVLGLGQKRQNDSLLGTFGAGDFSYVGWSRMPNFDWWWALVVIVVGLVAGSGYRLATSPAAARVCLTVRRVVYRMAKLMSPKLAAMIAPPADGPRQQTRHVAFYQRLTDVLSRHNILRLAHQTQREFANAAERFLRLNRGSGELVAIPQQIVDAFYRVRFGEEKLNDAEMATIEQALNRLDEVLSSESVATRTPHAMVE